MRMRVLTPLLLILAACAGGEAEPEAVSTIAPRGDSALSELDELLADPELNQQSPTPEQRLGISRERAEELWASMTGAEGAALVHKWDYPGGDELCVFQVNTDAWNGLPVDAKRDILTGTGKAAAILRGASHVNFTDAHTGKDLGVYSARMNSARLK